MSKADNDRVVLVAFNRESDYQPSNIGYFSSFRGDLERVGKEVESLIVTGGYAEVWVCRIPSVFRRGVKAL